MILSESCEFFGKRKSVNFVWFKLVNAVMPFTLVCPFNDSSLLGICFTRFMMLSEFDQLLYVIWLFEVCEQFMDEEG